MSVGRFKYTFTPVDERAGTRAESLPLLSVSQYRGVVPRADLAGDEGRAADLTNYKICRSGDIVLNRMSAYNGAVGLAGQPGLVSPDYLVLRPECHMAGRYMAYLIRSHWFVGEMTSRVRGIGSIDSGAVRTPRIGLSELGGIVVDIPSRDGQRAIADYLDRETAQIDAFIAKNEELIALLTERRASSIDYAFASASQTWTRLKYLARIQTGVTLGGEGDLSDPEWPYLRVANVQVGRIDLGEVKTVRVSESRARQSTLKPGDVLMTEGGDRDKLGRGAMWNGGAEPMLHQNHVFAVRTGDRLDARFLMRWLDASSSREYFEATAVQTTNLASTNKTLVGNLPLPYCSVATQVALVSDLDRRLEAIAASIDVARRGIVLARERRAALISAAVTGKTEIGASGMTGEVHDER